VCEIYSQFSSAIFYEKLSSEAILNVLYAVKVR